MCLIKKMKVIKLTVLIIMIPLAVLSQNGKVYEELSHVSKILNTERNYAIYLPPNYDSSELYYPVLYLLHGGGGNQTDWIKQGDVADIADKAINQSKVAPMIIIMPDAGTIRNVYHNDIRGDWSFEDYFFNELMPFVESKFRIKREKRFRAIAGLSMGGEATFWYANHYPEMFSSACSLSASFEVENYEDIRDDLVEVTKDMNIPEEKLIEVYQTYNVFHILESKTKEQLESVRWFFDCGDDDFLYEGNSLVHNTLRKKNVKHEFRIRDGEHSWQYWRESLPEVLSFVSETF